MSVDNLKGFSEAISSVFPKTEIPNVWFIKLETA